MKDEIMTLINAIETEDALVAQEQLNTIMMAKALDRLADMRSEIGSTMFNNHPDE